MQQPIPAHASSTKWWNPPPHVAKKVIAQAVRNIPNAKALMKKCYPPHEKLYQLPQHKYSDGGHLQWAHG